MHHSCKKRRTLPACSLSTLAAISNPKVILFIFFNLSQYFPGFKSRTQSNLIFQIQLCVFASGSISYSILRLCVEITKVFLHFGQNKGNLYKTVFSLICVRFFVTFGAQNPMWFTDTHRFSPDTEYRSIIGKLFFWAIALIFI